MGGDNLTQLQIKAKGSKELKDSLLQGDIKRIAKCFGKGYQAVYLVIIGTNYGDKNIVDCAEKLAAFYKSCHIDANRDLIFKNYEDLN